MCTCKDSGYPSRYQNLHAVHHEVPGTDEQFTTDPTRDRAKNKTRQIVYGIFALRWRRAPRDTRLYEEREDL